tara:strand:+ start:694 stop:1605 length:912 start_codon:yes stop_codon:yes gene_type:complete
MATLKSIAGKNGSGNTSKIATGKRGNQIPFGTPKHLIRLTKGTIIPSTTTFNAAYLLSLIQSGKAVPVMGSTSFERLTAEDGVSSTSDSTERLNLLGLAKYKLTFQEGHEFYRQMSKMTDFRNSDWLIVDDSSNMKIAINSKGDFVGFTAGQVISESVMEKIQGGDGESKSLTIQFTNRKQWDENYTIVTSKESQIDWEEIEGVNPVEITFVSVPTAADTTLVVSLDLSSDYNTNVEGALTANFSYKVDGVVTAVSGVAEDSGEYTLTIPALVSGKEIDLSLNGNINIEDVLFSSDSFKETIV